MEFYNHIFLLLVVLMFVTKSFAANVFCYFPTWSTRTSTSERFTDNDLDLSLCSHVIYAYAKVNAEKVKVMPFFPDEVDREHGKGFYRQITSKKSNETKMILSLGGQRSNTLMLVNLLGTAPSRWRLLSSYFRLVKDYEFDGIDFALEGLDDLNDDQIITMCHGIEVALNMARSSRRERLEVILTLSPKAIWRMGPLCSWRILRSVNYIIIKSEAVHPMEGSRSILQKQQQRKLLHSLSTVVDHGKVIITIDLSGEIVTYGEKGKTNILRKNNVKIDWSFSKDLDASNRVPIASESVAFSKTCKLLQQGWQVSWDRQRATPYAAIDHQVAFYQNEQSVEMQAFLVSVYGFGGVAVWSLNLDDFRGICGKGRNPLINSITGVLRHRSKDPKYYLENSDAALIQYYSMDKTDNKNLDILDLPTRRSRNNNDGKSEKNANKNTDNKIGNIKDPMTSQNDSAIKSRKSEAMTKNKKLKRKTQKTDPGITIEFEFSFDDPVQQKTVELQPKNSLLDRLANVLLRFIQQLSATPDGENKNLDSSSLTHKRAKRSVSDITGKGSGGTCTYQSIRADPSDCRFYYQCSNGRLYRYWCGNNAVFDPSLNSCVSPNNVAGCQGHRTVISMPEVEDMMECSHDGYYGHPSNCSRFFRCSDKLKLFFSCPNGLLFDSSSSSCDLPHRAQCSNQIDPSRRHGVLGMNHDVTGSRRGVTEFWPRDQISRNIASETYTLTPLELLPVEIADARQGYLPQGTEGIHSTNGKPVADIDNKQLKAVFTPGNLPEGLKQRRAGMATYPDGKFKCSKDGYFSDDSDCHKFFHCANGLPYHITCTGGLVFNPRTEICDWPYVVPNCATAMKKVFVPLDVELGKSTLESVASFRPDMTTAERKSKHNKTKATVTRPSTEKYGFLIPHLPFTTPDPRRSHGHRPFTSANPTTPIATPLVEEAVTNSVSKERQSDPAKLTSPTSREVGPVRSSYSRQGQLIPDGLSTTGCKRDGYRADPTDCRVFYICNSDGREYEFRCPEELVFNDQKGYCEPLDKVPRCQAQAKPHHQTMARNQPAKDSQHMIMTEQTETLYFSCPSQNGLFRHPHDCRKFFECHQGQQRLLTCPPNSVFDHQRHVCDVIRNVPDCYIRALFSGEITPSGSRPHGPYGEVLNDASRSSPDYDAGDSNPNSEHRCFNNGFFANPTDCNVFYECWNGQVTRLRCDHDMVFREDIQTCDWIRHVPRCLNMTSGDVIRSQGDVTTGAVKVDVINTDDEMAEQETLESGNESGIDEEVSTPQNAEEYPESGEELVNRQIELPEDGQESLDVSRLLPGATVSSELPRKVFEDQETDSDLSYEGQTPDERSVYDHWKPSDIDIQQSYSKNTPASSVESNHDAFDDDGSFNMTEEVSRYVNTLKEMSSINDEATVLHNVQDGDDQVANSDNVNEEFQEYLTRRMELLDRSKLFEDSSSREPEERIEIINVNVDHLQNMDKNDGVPLHNDSFTEISLSGSDELQEVQELTAEQQEHRESSAEEQIDENKPLGDSLIDENKPMGDSQIDENKPLRDSQIYENKPIGDSQIDENTPLGDSQIDQTRDGTLYEDTQEPEYDENTSLDDAGHVSYSRRQANNKAPNGRRIVGERRQNLGRTYRRSRNRQRGAQLNENITPAELQTKLKATNHSRLATTSPSSKLSTTAGRMRKPTAGTPTRNSTSPKSQRKPSRKYFESIYHSEPSMATAIQYLTRMFINPEDKVLSEPPYMQEFDSETFSNVDLNSMNDKEDRRQDMKVQATDERSASLQNVRKAVKQDTDEIAGPGAESESEYREATTQSYATTPESEDVLDMFRDRLIQQWQEQMRRRSSAEIACVSDGIFRHRTDCRKYFRCQGGRATAHECSAELVFSTRSHMCESVHNVPECFTYVQEGADRKTPQRREGTQMINMANIVTFDNDDFSCSHDGVYRKETDCKRFYECRSGRALEFECLTGFYFNSRSLTCDYLINVPECFVSHGASTNSQPSLQKEQVTSVYAPNKTKGTRVSSPQDATTMTSQETSITPKEAPRTITNITQGEERGQTGKIVQFDVSAKGGPCRSQGIYPDEQNCRRFYQCYDQEVRLVYCPEGLVFNSRKYLCDVPENVPWCRVRRAPRISTEKRTDLTLTSPQGRSGQGQPRSRGEERERSQRRPQRPRQHHRTRMQRPRQPPRRQSEDRTSFNHRYGYGERRNDPCPKQRYWRDEENCSIFYHCSGFVTHRFQCAAGLAFDPQKVACDYPRMVEGCNG